MGNHRPDVSTHPLRRLALNTTGPSPGASFPCPTQQVPVNLKQRAKLDATLALTGDFVPEDALVPADWLDHTPAELAQEGLLDEDDLGDLGLDWQVELKHGALAHASDFNLAQGLRWPQQRKVKQQPSWFASWIADHYSCDLDDLEIPGTH